MIAARYDQNGNIILDLKLIGTCGEKKVKVLMDTGFSGALAIPVSTGCEIGLEGVGEAQVIVASGESIPVPIFLGKLKIGDEIIECLYIVLPGSNEVLIGMEIIKDYNVQFHGA
ncbi:MAG: aspartyl protease family protein, partial [Nanoarchaeota archaeon]|nr:aspartyl protease family protein [Nanoarchaeota archaeon]